MLSGCQFTEGVWPHKKKHHGFKLSKFLGSKKSISPAL